LDRRPPGKFHDERIASVAKREMSTYYGAAQHQVKATNLVELIHWHDLLVKPKRKVIDRNKPFEPTSNRRTAG
jgi:hypothetical protein